MTTTQAGETSGRQSALYTPEAVKVDLPLADVGSRSLAILIDLFVMFTLLYIVLLLAVAGFGLANTGAGDGPGWVVVVILLVLNFLVLWGYPTGCETLLNGRTAGKAALGLRVVTIDGAPVRFRHAAIRGLFAFVDFYLFLGIPALVSALLTSKGQRLGDLAAGTVTVRDRATDTAADQAVRFQVPPALQGYASTLDVRGLSAADYAVVRRFLLRSGSLQPEHRARIAADLANVLADRMHHRPPAGTHPEALLLCTAALLQGTGNAAPARPVAARARSDSWQPPAPSGSWQPPAPSGSWQPPSQTPPPGRPPSQTPPPGRPPSQSPSPSGGLQPPSQSPPPSGLPPSGTPPPASGPFAPPT